MKIELRGRASSREPTARASEGVVCSPKLCGRIDGDRAEVLLDGVWQSVTWAKSARGLQAAQEAKGPEVALAASRPSGQSRGRTGDLRIFSAHLA